MDIFDTTTLSEAGITEADATADALRKRANILRMTQTAEDAVLAPAKPGAWSPSVRAALAARMARLNGETSLADELAKRIEDASLIPLADPATGGSEQGMSAVVAFMDKVAVQTREIRAEDIESLKSAGIGDDDIVRLAELNAFMAYQIRLVAGLKLMRGAQ